MKRKPKKQAPSRRALLRAGASAAAGLAAAGLATSGILPTGLARAEEEGVYRANRGRIRQSVVKWCFRTLDVATLARHAQAMGIESVELVPPEDWPLLKKLGLTCAIAPSHGFTKGFANLDEQPECIEILRRRIDDASAAGVPNVITFSGFRRGGMSDEEAIANMVAGYKKIVGHAEAKKVNLCLEMLNTRVAEEMKGHPGYMCDRIEYAVEVSKRVGSERMKILFDIYHVQIMQGDVIVRLREAKEHIAHYHTAGVPGRRELDDGQEIHYVGVMRAIAETGYKGFVGQEFIPTWQDPVAALNHAVKVCDV
jgi:hydroxypyruvate isomerase